MDSQEELIRIGDFARLASTNLRTLRYYEELGLLTPASRSTGGFRYYCRHHLDRVAAIKRLQHLGLSLKEIQEMLARPDGAGGPELVQRMETALERQRQLIEARIGDLRGDLAELDRASEKLQRCRTCSVQLSLESCDPCVQDHEAMSTVFRALL